MVLAWRVGGADSGYVAVRVWRRVHVLRPSCSTSGGQSRGMEDVRVDVDEVGDVLLVVVEEVWDLVRAAHEAKDVQERQLLERGVSRSSRES